MAGPAWTDWRGSASNMHIRNGSSLLSSAFLAATLLTAGCNSPSTAPAEAPNNAVDNAEEARLVEANCIGTAMQATVFSNLAGTDLAGAFAAQGHENCPADFRQQFTVAGEAMRRVVEAQSELNAHLQREDDATRRSSVNTANDLWDGRTSGKRPYEEWMERKAGLEEALSNTKSTYGEARSTLVAIAARYGSYPETTPPSEEATNAAGNVL
ncbi:MAG: hypothetical protein V4461_13105 [Pseudomonadota bacterium]